MKNSKPTLATNVYESLKRDIIDNRLAPNQKLKITELAKHYDTGTAPVREALSKLASSGFVIAESQKGFRVAPISLEELKDLYYAKRLIEMTLLAESIKEGDDAWEAALLASYHRLSKLESSDERIDPFEWEQRNREFHCAMTSACPSKYLLAINQQIYEATQRYRHLWVKEAAIKKATLKKNNQEHKALLNAALNRDIEKLQKLYSKHIEKSLNKAMNYLVDR